MRSGKELILASKEFVKEDRARSWMETIGTLLLLSGVLFATFLPLPIEVSFGASTLQRSVANGQRVWNLQPLGGLEGEGISPFKITFSLSALGSGVGLVEIRAKV